MHTYSRVTPHLRFFGRKNGLDAIGLLRAEVLQEYNRELPFRLNQEKEGNV